MSTTTTEPDFQLVESFDEWEEAAVHTPVLPSGRRVKMKVLDLPALIEAGEIPQHLMEAAMGVATADEKFKPDVQFFAREREFTDRVCILSVVAPTLNEANVKRIPAEDRAMLAAWATRARDVDAIGDHIGGLSTSEKFRRFRELGEFKPTLEGL